MENKKRTQAGYTPFLYFQQRYETAIQRGIGGLHGPSLLGFLIYDSIVPSYSFPLYICVRVHYHLDEVDDLDDLDDELYDGSTYFSTFLGNVKSRQS